MAHRKQVFQSKVLQKLYHTTSTLRTECTPSPVTEAKAKTASRERKTSGLSAVSGDARKTQDAANPPRRMYTVLPPPPDYNIHLDKSLALPQLESINSDEDPAGESVNFSSEEVDKQNEEEEQRKRKRRRKRKQVNSEKNDTPANESCTDLRQVSADDSGDRIGRNRKRKLKKKRHKEKLLSMGLMPRAAALEFTYHKDKDEDEEDNKRRAAELSDFLRTTAEIYKSDSSLHAVRNPHLSAVMDDLLTRIASGNKPNSVLKQLFCLKSFVQQKETESLEKALTELNNNTIMSAEETTAVVSLFKYWITDIFPLQRDETTKLSPAHT